MSYGVPSGKKINISSVYNVVSGLNMLNKLYYNGNNRDVYEKK